MQAQSSVQQGYEWLDELTPILEHYWETGETPDDLDIDWFDAMIALVEPEAIRELNMA